MEEKGFAPTSEPTDRQRRFFRDTAYADDELQLRRTILARIATLDTSVTDPTDDQLAETLEMLRGFKGTEEPSNAWEANALDRIIALVGAVEPKRAPAAPKSGAENAAAGAGETEDDRPVPQPAIVVESIGTDENGNHIYLEESVSSEIDREFDDTVSGKEDDASALDDLFEGNRADENGAVVGSETAEERKGREAAESIAEKMGELARSGAEITGETVSEVTGSVMNPPAPTSGPMESETAGTAEPAKPEPVGTDKLGRPKDGVRRDLAGRELNSDGTIKTAKAGDSPAGSLPVGGPSPISDQSETDLDSAMGRKKRRT